MSQAKNRLYFNSHKKLRIIICVHKIGHHKFAWVSIFADILEQYKILKGINIYEFHETSSVEGKSLEWWYLNAAFPLF